MRDACHVHAGHWIRSEMSNSLQAASQIWTVGWVAHGPIDLPSQIHRASSCNSGVPSGGCSRSRDGIAGPVRGRWQGQADTRWAGLTCPLLPRLMPSGAQSCQILRKAMSHNRAYQEFDTPDSPLGWTGSVGWIWRLGLMLDTSGLNEP